MRTTWSWAVIAGLVLLGASGTRLTAVRGASGAPTMASATQAAWAPPDKDMVARGELWFLQRCALCHVDRVTKDVTYKQVLGPYLTGILKDASPSREAQVRETIKKGGFRMPGFEYGLNAREFEELIAYLKTL